MWAKILMSCFTMIGFMVSACSAEEEILIVTEEWPPYNYSEDGTVTGFSTEIVHHLLEVMNKDYEIQLLPSMRSTATLNTRPRTMMFSMFRTPERESQYKWIGPLGDASIFFYKQKDSPLRIDSLDDMKDANLDVCSRQAGVIYDLLLEHGFQNLDASATKSLSIYQKLLAGRCDLAISDADLGVRYNLKLLDVALDDVFEKIPIPIFEAELYIAASKDIADEEIQQWQSALDTLKTSGVYESIFKRYQ